MDKVQRPDYSIRNRMEDEMNAWLLAAAIAALLLDLVHIFPGGREIHRPMVAAHWPEPAKADLVAVPEGEEITPENGFLEVLYHLYSTTKREGPLVLRARTADRGENAEIPSVVSVYRSAEFQEREIFDL